MLYTYAKTKDLPKSLKQNLLHEMLSLSIMLDSYDEVLFKEYIRYPLERNHYLKDKKALSFN